MGSTATRPPDFERADPVYIVGCGSVGTALALAFLRRGVAVAGAHCRTPAGASRAGRATGLEVTSGSVPSSIPPAATVLLAVPDPAIRDVADALRERGALSARQVVLHCSGARSSAELDALREHCSGVGCFHPLLSFADPALASELLPAAAFAVEGDPVAVRTARSLAVALGGEAIHVAADDRPLYHAAAAIASNHLVALCSHAARCLRPVGIPRDVAVRALATLMRSTVANLDRVGLPGALTGPISRGDAGTVAAHLQAISGRAPADLDLYVAMAREALRVAREQGAATEEGLARVERELTVHGRSGAG
jgi:predicted short-subunit dehydrogenase-like oxidoreductase (DUF2520 family)